VFRAGCGWERSESRWPGAVKNRRIEGDSVSSTTETRPKRDGFRATASIGCRLSSVEQPSR
jgi:hypothetical protein